MMIEIKNLTKTYGDTAVVDDLSLTVKTGSTFGFLGQNGAGKTTTIKMMVGLARPDAGTVTIGGKPTSDPAAREQVGFMPEAPYFYERLTGLEFLRFCGQLFTQSYARPDDDYRRILTTVGIGDAADRPIRVYSKGMKQRLGFAQTLVNDPAYVFLDEPLDGLDPIGRREIKAIIHELHRQGKTIFFNSHILYDTEELCDEVGIIHRGRLLYAGPVKEFCRRKPLEERFVEVVTAATKNE